MGEPYSHRYHDSEPTALVALSVSWVQIDEFRKAEQVHQLVEQSRFFMSADFRKIRKRLADFRLDKGGKLLPLKADAPPEEMYQVLNYFEEIALLEKRGYLDAEDIWEQLGYWAFNTYADAKPVIEHDRLEDPTVYTDFERLIGVLEKIEIAATGRPRPLPKSEIEDFYQYQQKLISD